jgi:hypothetical protein
MTDRQEFHPIFGISRRNGSTDTRSKCGHTIPEEHVPLLGNDLAERYNEALEAGRRARS